MQITLNGKITNIEKNLTISNLLKKYNIEPNMVAIEINLDILPVSQYEEREIKDGDKIELVEFVGGG